VLVDRRLSQQIVTKCVDEHTAVYVSFFVLIDKALAFTLVTQSDVEFMKVSCYVFFFFGCVSVN
jgi:uncharacterized protein YhbP (UPF0306 family)